MDVSMQQIEEYEAEHNNTKDRWVEIPNDFENVSIFDFDQIICKMNYANDDKIELGIEIFDDNNKWPFRNPQLVPTKEEIAINESNINQQHQKIYENTMRESRELIHHLKNIFCSERKSRLESIKRDLGTYSESNQSG